MDLYVERVFSPGLESYRNSLAAQGVTGKTRILDLGCGPGQWAMAAAMLNPGATVLGVDRNDYLTTFARGRAAREGLANCSFEGLTFQDLLARFPANAFDVIMCNSVIQYCDEAAMADLIGSLLRKRGGLLVMFWNHAIAYYLLKAFRGGPREWLFATRVLVVDPMKASLLKVQPRDHAVHYGRLERVFAERGIRLYQVASIPALDYRERFLGLPCVFSCCGVAS